MTKSKTPIRFYGFAPYDRGAKARWLLCELGIDYECKWLDPEKGDFADPHFLSLNPMGRIPVVEMDDTSIFESGAICAYVADRFIGQGLAPGLDSPHRAKYQQWMYFAATTLDSFQSRIMIIEDIPAGKLREEKESALLEEVKDACSALELTLTKSPFLVADRFSAADICVAYNLYWFEFWPELKTVVEQHPKLSAYLERMKKMPSAVQAKAFSYEP
jgi:glutathione S-transferase